MTFDDEFNGITFTEGPKIYELYFMYIHERLLRTRVTAYRGIPGSLATLSYIPVSR